MGFLQEQKKENISFVSSKIKIITKQIKTWTNILLEKTYAVEKMAHTTRNLDILLVSAKKDPVVVAHMHTTNKETAGERS